MKMAIITASAGANCLPEAAISWGGRVPIYVEDGRQGILPAYQRGLTVAAADDYDILAFMHDDLVILEEFWWLKVLHCFYDPKVGLVGFGGALRHGSHDLYKAPYRLEQLARFDFMSNLEDAEVHGKRFAGMHEVAVLDGIALIFRTEVLRKAGGWPIGRLTFHCYDYFASAITHRLGYKVWMTGVACRHLGGRTSVGLKLDDGLNHAPAHEYIATEFADVLPWEVKP